MIAVCWCGEFFATVSRRRVCYMRIISGESGVRVEARGAYRDPDLSRHQDSGVVESVVRSHHT